MTSLANTIRATAEAYLSSFIRASKTKNMKEISANCTPECRRVLGPASFLEHIGAPPDYSMSNTEYEDQFGTMAFYELTDCIISRLVVDVEQLKAAGKAELIGAFHDGRKIHRTNVWFMEFTPDGTKVCDSYQHVDYRESMEFRKLVSEYAAKAEAEKHKGTADPVFPMKEDDA